MAFGAGFLRGALKRSVVFFLRFRHDFRSRSGFRFEITRRGTDWANPACRSVMAERLFVVGFVRGALKRNVVFVLRFRHDFRSRSVSVLKLRGAGRIGQPRARFSV